MSLMMPRRAWAFDWIFFQIIPLLGVQARLKGQVTEGP